MKSTDESNLKFSQLRFPGFTIIGIALLALLVSSFIDWRIPAWGILICGHRTDVFLGAMGLALLGCSLIVSGFSNRHRGWTILSGILLSMSAVAIGLSPVEWYLRHPSRLHLRVAPRILDLANDRVEPGIGLRWSVPPGSIRIWAPTMTIPLTRVDPTLLAAERQEVEFHVDQFGFPNRSVPDSADIVVLGDSFTLVVDVPWDQRWMNIVSRTTGHTIYNISQGGFCPSQEVQLYNLYGNIKGVRLVLLGLYGVNDLGGERNFSHFLESGLEPREWAYRKAHKLLPKPTFGFIQVAIRWWAEQKISIHDSDLLDPITVSNTEPPTLVSYYPGEQLRAWECVFMEPQESRWARSITESIAQLAETCRKKGILAGVLYFPTKQTIHPPDPDDQEPWIAFLKQSLPWIEPEGWDREKIVMAGRLLLEGDRRLESYISTACDSLGVLFHSVRPALEHEVETTGKLTYYRFDVHWNVNGNVAVGRDVAAWIDTIFRRR